MVLRALIFAVVVLGVLAPAARAGELVDIPIPDRNGEIPSQWLARYPEGGPPRAKVLLPDGYDPRKKYPLLVLLVGLSSHYTDWSDPGEGEIEKTVKGFPGIVVMPEGGDGWYTDYWNGGKRGEPAWESYTLDQIIPQVLERYPIRRGRRWHVLGGNSMGGYGAAYIGGRLPAFFGSLVVLSGFVDLDQYSAAGVGAFQSGMAYAGATQPPTDPFIVTGPSDGFYQQGHNPPNLAANLRHTRVYMTVGDGTPVFNPSTGVVGQSEEIAFIRPMSDTYAAALRKAGVDLTYVVRPGYHDWNNFRPALQDAIAKWKPFEPVVRNPRRWVNDTVATRGDLWGFAYRFDAPPDRVVRFRRRGRTLRVGAAGSPVTVTVRGCTLKAATPAKLRVPRRAC